MASISKTRRRGQCGATPKQNEKRERIRHLAKIVGALSPDERTALAMRAGIRTIEGHELSPFNACLLLYQFRGVSVVGGYRQWLRAGRCVRKGQTGLSLWIPCTRKGADGESPETFFNLATVFDVSQTDELETEAEGGAA